jgi:hypothetical protein
MSRSSSGSGSPYRLDELGWLQFDRLCGLVLDAEAGVGDLDWRGQSDSVRVATVETPVVLRNPKVLLNGPVTVAVLWIRDDGPADVRLSEPAGRIAPLLGDLDGSVADELLLLTNPELAASARSAITIAGLAEDLEQQRWWMPEDIVAPPNSEPVCARTDFTYLDVTRVLNDL